MDRLLTVRDVAAKLGVCLDTAYKLISRGKLDAVRIGTRTLRVSPKSLERYIEKQRCANLNEAYLKSPRRTARDTG